MYETHDGNLIVVDDEKESDGESYLEENLESQSSYSVQYPTAEKNTIPTNPTQDELVIKREFNTQNENKFNTSGIVSDFFLIINLGISLIPQKTMIADESSFISQSPFKETEKAKKEEVKKKEEDLYKELDLNLHNMNNMNMYYEDKSSTRGKTSKPKTIDVFKNHPLLNKNKIMKPEFQMTETKNRNEIGENEGERNNQNYKDEVSVELPILNMDDSGLAQNIFNYENEKNNRQAFQNLKLTNLQQARLMGKQKDSFIMVCFVSRLICDRLILIKW